MYTIKVLFAIGLLGSLSIASNGAANAQQIENSSQTSAATIDRQMSDEARTPLSGTSFNFTVSFSIIRYWEKIVDVAGLHSLLNQNQKAYTLFEPRFDLMRQQHCIPAQRSVSPPNVPYKQILQCMADAPHKENFLSKLFAMENQPDLQRVLKCHVVPQKIILKDLPNDKELTFKTMEPGCTITLKAKHSQNPEMKSVSEQTSNCGMQGIGNVVCVPSGQITRSVRTGKTANRTELFFNGISKNFQTDEINKGVGNYIVYNSFIEGVILPPDLKGKYENSPPRPLTD